MNVWHQCVTRQSIIHYDIVHCAIVLWIVHVTIAYQISVKSLEHDDHFFSETP